MQERRVKSISLTYLFLSVSFIIKPVEFCRWTLPECPCGSLKSSSSSCRWRGGLRLAAGWGSSCRSAWTGTGGWWVYPETDKEVMSIKEKTKTSLKPFPGSIYWFWSLFMGFIDKKKNSEYQADFSFNTSNLNYFFCSSKCTEVYCCHARKKKS